MSAQYRLIDDLGVFSVDPTYTHARCLDLFRLRVGDDFYKFNEDITDEHFSHPSKILTPGSKIRVKTFTNARPGVTSYRDRIRFLKDQSSVFVGAQGIPFVYTQLRNKVTRGHWYMSLDVEENLFLREGKYRIPRLDARTGDDKKVFAFNLDVTDIDSTDFFAFFGFFEA